MNLVKNDGCCHQEAEDDSEDASDLDEELFNDPDTQEIIRNLVL